jgi:hypothetical protein
MSAHTVLKRIDRDGMHRKLVRRPEYTDRNFLRSPSAHVSIVSGKAGGSGGLVAADQTLRLTPRLATRIFVSGPLWPAALRRIVWIECTGVPGALGDPADMFARRGGCNPEVAFGAAMSGIWDRRALVVRVRWVCCVERCRGWRWNQ